MTAGAGDDPLAGLHVDEAWDADPERHPEWAPWRKLAEDWTPEDSLKRIDGKASFVFGNVALVGTLAAGLGLIAGSGVPNGVRWLGWVAGALLVLALVLALAVTMPSWRTSLPRPLSALKRTYERWISVKGWLVRGSLLCYAGAFAAGIALLLGSIVTPAEPLLGLTIASGDKGTTVTATVTAQAVDDSAEATTTLVALFSGRPDQNLARDVRKAGAAGTLSVALTAGAPPGATSYRLVVEYRDRSGTGMGRSIEITG